MGRLKVGNASAESRLFLMGAGFAVLLALAVGVAASSSSDPLEQHEAVWSESLDLSARGLTDDELGQYEALADPGRLLLVAPSIVQVERSLRGCYVGQ